MRKPPGKAAYLLGAVESASHLDSELDPRAVPSLLDAAFEFHGTNSKQAGIHRRLVFSLSIEQLGYRDLAAVIVPVREGTHVLGIYSSLERCEEAFQHFPPDVPFEVVTGEFVPGLSLLFLPSSEAASSYLQQIAELGWSVGHEDDIPVAFAKRSAKGGFPRQHRSVLLEAVTRALTAMFQDAQALRLAGLAGKPFHRTIDIGTYQGEFEVQIAAPAEALEESQSEVSELMVQLASLSSETKKSTARTQELQERLLRLFEQSPEREGLSGTEFVSWLIQEASEQHGKPLVLLDHEELIEVLDWGTRRRMVLGEHIPADALGQMSALYRFVYRESRAPIARSALDLLDSEVISPLRRMAESPLGFDGYAKLFKTGTALGFDMGKTEEMEKFAELLASADSPFVRLLNSEQELLAEQRRERLQERKWRERREKEKAKRRAARKAQRKKKR